MIWHPDKFESEDEKKEAEKKFMDIAAAKEVLSDPGWSVTPFLNNNLCKILDGLWVSPKFAIGLSQHIHLTQCVEATPTFTLKLEWVGNSKFDGNKETQ